MTVDDPLDVENICAVFADRPDNEGYTETDFQAVMASLLARGIVCRVAYQAADGSTRNRIEPVELTALDAAGHA